MLPAELIILLLILGSLASTTGDPCKNHSILDQPWRSSNCSETRCSGRWMDDGKLTEGWYRFSSHGNVKIPETTVPFFHCSTWSPGWLKGPHPDVGAGEVTRTICFNWVQDNPQGHTCTKQMDITIKNCTAYFVYKLKPTPGLYSVYCTVTDSALGDPCVNYSILDRPWRRMNSPSMSEQCMSDKDLKQGWYRFSSSGRWKIPETAVPQYCCCGKRQGWLEGSHPTVTEGEVMRKVCFTENGNNNHASDMSQNNNTCLDIKIKNCIGYFVYLLKPTLTGHNVYCAGSILRDPCANHTILDQPWRSTDCSSEKCSKYMNDETRTEGWYQFKSSGGWRIPETVVPTYKCSGKSSGWLNGSHPSVGEGEVHRTVCFIWEQNNCETKRTIKIKNCGAFFVYWLKPTLCCNKVYCTDPASVPTPQPKGTTPEPSDDLSMITDPATGSDPICVPTPQPKGTSVKPSNDFSTIMDPDSTSDPASVPTSQREGTTPEPSDDLSTFTDPDTSSDPQISTSEETRKSSAGEHTEEPLSVPVGDASTDPTSVPTPQPEGTTPEPSDDLSTITDPDTSSDPTSVPTPQPKGTSPEPSDDLSTITDPDTSSDSASDPTPQPKGITPESSDDLSTINNPETNSDSQISTSEKARNSSSGEYTQEPSSVPVGDTSTAEGHSESSTKGPIQETSSAQEEEMCTVKGLPTKEQCEEMINTAQVLHIGQNNPENSDMFLQQIRKILIEQTPCKYVLSKYRK
ncbi:uncharacterized protein [Hemitrygon akajei]|uniref:uncharacterized protein n=1 Tax=Hemitrygon akajei TaxID=2704970 RepID=UPI003BF9602C